MCVCVYGAVLMLQGEPGSVISGGGLPGRKGEPGIPGIPVSDYSTELSLYGHMYPHGGPHSQTLQHSHL